MDSTSTVRSARLQDSESQPACGDRGTTPSDSAANGLEANVTARAPALEGGRSPRESLPNLYGPVLEPLARVEQRLGLELQSPYESLTAVLRHGTQLGGKRLRPAMLLLAGAAVGELTPDHLVLGTVIEMVHTATLVHDDVLDEAETRRHVATINSRWNQDTSILLGDYLFAQSFRLAATLPSIEACRWIGEAARLVCEGELRQVLLRDVVEMDEECYLSIIRGKTAELCRVACQLGARFSAGEDRVVEALGNYGDAVGIAFQIADDYLDLWGDDATVGKTLGTDIGQGKMTLPLIRLLETASRIDRSRIVGILRGPAGKRLEQIRPYLQQSDARQYTRRIAEKFKHQAIESLGILGNSAAKESLLAIAEFSMDRRF